MLSISHWGCFDGPYSELMAGDQWTLADLQEMRAALTADLKLEPAKTRMPDWWVPSGYQYLSFDEPSYDSRYLHGGQRSTYQRLNFGELA